MSKPRYWWYGNVCRTICEFPKLDRQVRDMSRQKITPGYSAQPGGHSSGRAVEDIAVRVLSSREYEDYAAVQAAINTAQTWRDGADVLEIVRLHAWKAWNPPRAECMSASRQPSACTAVLYTKRRGSLAIAKIEPTGPKKCATVIA